MKNYNYPDVKSFYLSADSTPIGNHPLSLATHLRAVVDLLLDTTRDNGYDWCENHSCNCGLLARSILGCSPEALINALRLLPARNNSFVFVRPECEEVHFSQALRWSGHVAGLCAFNQTETLREILQRLSNAGLLPEDYRHLEFLCHPHLNGGLIAWSPSDSDIVASDPSNVATYCLRWAQAIEAFHAARASEVTEAIETTMEAGVVEEATNKVETT